MIGLSIKSIAIVLILTAVVLAGQDDPILERYIQQALSDNPSLKAAGTRVEAFNERIPQAGALPDPMLGFGIANLPINSFELNQEAMTGKWVSLGQKFPFPGKLGIKENIAGHQRDRQQAMMESVKSQLIRKVKETYYNWSYIRTSIEIVESNQALMDQFVDIALSKYQVGIGLQQDVLRAQTERTKFENRLLDLRQMEATLKARLNTLLNHDVDAELQPPKELDFQTISISSDSIITIAMTSNPSVQAYHARERMTDAMVKLAKKNYYPDLKIGAKYTQRDDTPAGMKRYDFFSIQAEIGIPLYWKSKQDRLLQQKQIEQRQVDEEFQDVLKDLEFRLSDLLLKETRTRDQIDVYQTGIIPQASQTLESALSGYQVGKVDFLTLLSSQMALYNYQLDLKQKYLEYKLVWSQLESLTGQRIF